ncbi:uncharacterized protein [Argopecten irradians]|uniref:uncharacterized protein n=1 Tax=Argopecten irradians TaxID=31199 RepID=UPI003711FDA7
MRGIASQSCGTKTVGESSPASFQDNLDTAARNPGVGYLANQYTFDCCGVITSWNAVIGALGTVKFQIWRPSGANYELVGHNEYTFSTADQLIEQTLSVPNADIPTVLPNDVLGWYSANNDMIPYSSVAGTGAIQQTMAAPSLGSSVSWTPGATLSGRTYAVGALTGVNSVPTFTNLDQTLTYLDTDTPPTTLLTLTTTDADPQDTVLTVAMTTTSNEFQLSTDQVQPQTGQWTVGTYPLSFTVTDQCGNEGTGTLTVEITNTAPDMTAMVTADSIREDVTTQTHMTDLTVTDEQSYTCTYTGSAPFNVQPKVTGSTTYALFVNGEAGLNYNTQNQYTLPITCTDDLGLSTTKDIVVSITENPPPTMTNLPGAVDVDTTTTTSSAVDVDTTTTTSSAVDVDTTTTTSSAVDVDTTTNMSSTEIFMIISVYDCFRCCRCGHDHYHV